MTEIISFERFKSQYKNILEKYKILLAKDKEKGEVDINFKKIGRIIKNIRSIYGRDKVYAVRYLNYLEKYQCMFSEEKRALIVKAVELCQKVILHKKLRKVCKTKPNS